MDAAMAAFKARLDAWRSLPHEDQVREMMQGDGALDLDPADTRGKARVGWWFPCLAHGGGEAHMLALARHADPARVCWVGAVGFDGSANCHPAQAAELSALMPVGYGRKAARRLAQAADVVISWATSDPSDVLAGIERPPALIQVSHFPAEVGGLYGTPGLLDRVSRFAAVSPSARAAVPESHRDGAAVVWNAVDPSRMVVARDRDEVRASWTIPPGSKVVGFLGRLVGEKGTGVFVEAARALPDRYFVLVGDGRDRPALEAAARDLPNVRVVGPDGRAGDVLGAFDCLLAPSRYESFGLSIAEALWAGVPVISTAVGLATMRPGVTRVVPQGASGRDWAAAILADESDGGTRHRVRQAREFARERLSPARFGREWSDLLHPYRTTIARRRPASAVPCNMRLSVLADLCPYGSGPCGCRDAPPRSCGHPDRPAWVRKAECVRCQERQWWESGSDRIE